MKNNDQRRTIKKNVRFSPNEYFAIQGKKQELNIFNFCKYARLKILSKTKLFLQDEKEKGGKEATATAQIMIAQEVNKIVNNLNQNAKAMNEQLKTGGQVIERLASNFQTFTEHLIEVKIKILDNKKYFNDTKNILS
jgi:hypothetical protein